MLITFKKLKFDYCLPEVSFSVISIAVVLDVVVVVCVYAYYKAAYTVSPPIKTTPQIEAAFTLHKTS